MTDFQTPKLEGLPGGKEGNIEGEIVKRAFTLVQGNRLPAIEPTKPVDKLKYDLAKIEDSEFYKDREIYALCQALIMVELATRDAHQPLQAYVEDLAELIPEDAPKQKVNAGIILYDSLEMLNILFSKLGSGQMGQQEVEEFVDREVAEIDGVPSKFWYDQNLLSRMVESINIAKQLAVDGADQRNLSVASLIGGLKEAVAEEFVGASVDDLESDDSHSMRAAAWGELAKLKRASQHN